MAPVTANSAVFGQFDPSPNYEFHHFPARKICAVMVSSDPDVLDSRRERNTQKQMPQPCPVDL
jgi:hypothetical protein